MDSLTLIQKAISTILMFKFVLIPLFGAISIFYGIAESERSLKHAGNIIAYSVNFYPKKNSAIFGFITLISSLLLMIFGFGMGFILFILGAMNVGQYFSFKKYSKINGIYQNGLIAYEYIAWSKIHSFKRIDSNAISFLKRDGTRLDMSFNEKYEKVIEIIENEKVAEELKKT